MISAVAYVRRLLGDFFGWDDDSSTKPKYKRDRCEDDSSSDDDTPTFKRLKKLRKSSFPDIMTSNSNVLNNSEEHSPIIRYVPIQFERQHPSTSTPNNKVLEGKVKKAPIKFVDISENGPSTSVKPRMHTPVKPVIHAVIEDDDENENEVIYVGTKKKPSKIYIEDDDCENQEDDDITYVKKITAPPTRNAYKFFVSKNDYKDTDVPNMYDHMCKKLNNRLNSKSQNKFKFPPGITKPYKKVAEPMPKWMHRTKSNLSKSNMFYGNGRTTLSEVFNLDEKKTYQDLIKRVIGSSKVTPISKKKNPIDMIVADARSFRDTQKVQRRSLNEIKLVETDISLKKKTDSIREYDPVTIASIYSSDSEGEVVLSESSNTSSVKIARLNSLQDTFKEKPVVGKDWLTNLNNKYKKKLQETQEKAHDVHRACDIITKVNLEQRVAHLEHQLKYELSIPESLITEAPPTVELPELTPEQEKLINKALGPGPLGQVLVEKFSLRITRQDLKTLSGLNWLNDEVINFYMNLLIQRSEEKKDLPKVYATNTFFYPKLMQSGQAGLRRWTRKVDIFAHNLIIVPVHLGVHWCLSIIDFRSKKISYLDSMGSRNQKCLDALLQYLRDEHKDKKGQPFDDNGWKTENLKDIPQQMNGSDCGMFACTFAEFTCRNAPYSFSQQHMPYLRRKAVLEILQGRLLL